MDSEFFKAFPNNGLVRQLARLDMSADEVPAIWIPLTQWMAMHHEHETVAHKCSDRDRNPGDHVGTLGEDARPGMRLAAAHRASTSLLGEGSSDCRTTAPSRHRW